MKIPTSTLCFTVGLKDIPTEKGNKFFVKWSHVAHHYPGFRKCGQTQQKSENGTTLDFYDDVFSYEVQKGSGQVWKFQIYRKNEKGTEEFLLGVVNVYVDPFLTSTEDRILKFEGGKEGSLIVKKCLPMSFKLGIRDLPKMDVMSKCDPYIKCYWSYGMEGEQHFLAETTVVNNVKECVWEDPVTFKNYQPGTEQFLTFKVFDKDTMTKDDFVGDAQFSVKGFISHQSAIYEYRLENCSSPDTTITLEKME